MKIYWSIFCLLFNSLLFAQPTVEVLNWPNGAQAAYTLVHDDFGMQEAEGIERYADTMAYNRGLRFSYGPVTDFCNHQDWENGKRLCAHGHEVINHSHRHLCGKEVEWCSFGNWKEKDFDREMNVSAQLIKDSIGQTPRFFIFPFDLFTDTMINYLQVHPYYYGARAGAQNKGNKASTRFDPYRINFTVHRPEQGLAEMLNDARQAIQDSTWFVQVAHGVEDRSWGSISLNDYESLLDSLSAWQKSGKLYVGTLEELTRYRLTSERYTFTLRAFEKGFALKSVLVDSPKDKKAPDGTISLVLSGLPEGLQVQDLMADWRYIGHGEYILTFTPSSKILIIK
jgi:hypothetical protein